MKSTCLLLEITTLKKEETDKKNTIIKNCNLSFCYSGVFCFKKKKSSEKHLYSKMYNEALTTRLC